MRKFMFISITLILSMMTSCSKFPDIGNGYQLDYNGMNDVSIIKCLKEGDAPTIFIYGHILEYAFDSTFIIVAERPRDSIQECTGTIPGMTLKKCDEAFEKSTFRQYWIIDKRQESIFDEKTKIYSNVYGPYKKESFIEKLKELAVSEELKLKE